MDVWHRTNLEYPYYAEDYVAICGELWTHAPATKQALRRLWHDPDVRGRRARWLEIGQELGTIAEAVRSGNEEAQTRRIAF